MANKYYGVDLGGSKPADVTVADATTNKAVELVVNRAATNLNKQLLLNAIEAIKELVSVRDWVN